MTKPVYRKKTLYITLDNETVDVLDTLLAFANLSQDEYFTHLLNKAFKKHNANLAKFIELENEKVILLSRIKDIDDQLKQL